LNKKNQRHPQFPQDDDILYFNHAAVAPWPACTVAAVNDFCLQNLHAGSKNYLNWLETETSLRESLRWLINADSIDDIALLKNTSEGLSVIAYGLDWEPGDNVVIPADEFPSNRIVWQSLKRFGVETRQVNIRQTNDPEQALLDAMDEKTRLLSVSAVQYTDGFRLDLVKLGNNLIVKDALFVVDAIQQLGALEFDNKQVMADFVVADGHKWMLGPEGLALFYSHPRAREKLNLNQYGWHMVENPTDFMQQEWHISHTAKRFECGSPNMITAFALQTSLQLIRQTGIETIQETILDNSNNIMNYIDNSNSYDMINKLHEKRRSGIVLFKHKTLRSSVLHQRLTDAGIQCAERANGIRLSPHYYHAKWEFDRLFNQLSSI